MSRPSEYKEKYTHLVDKYLDEYSDSVEVVGDNKPTILRTVKLPTIEGYAKYIGVNKSSLYEWKEKHKEFSYSLEKILIEQKQRLINEGLSGNYNSTIAKLVLSSNHGMNEKQELDAKVEGNISLTDLFDKAQKKDEM